MNHITRPLPPLPADENHEPQKISIGRRGFLTTAAAAGGGLMIGLTLGTKQAAAVTTATVNTWVVIGSDNSITIITPGAEMGQGINSGLAQALAEELPLDWTKVQTLSAPYGAQYGLGPYASQVTGGSFNTRSWFTLMLAAGATARQLLINAAAAKYPAAPPPLKAVAGTIQDSTNKVLDTYGALAVAAAAITPLPTPTILSATNGYKFIGTSAKRPDIPLKVDGSAVFGLDVRVANMVYAAVRHCPTTGGTVGTMPAAPAGTLGVVNLGNAVAVVADNTWKAIQAANSLQVGWVVPSDSALAAVDSSSLSSQAQSLMSSGTPATAEKVGDLATAMASATKTLTMTYSLPLLPHACMEVLNCTVSITKTGGAITGCEIWSPTQAPDWVAGTAAAMTGLNRSQVIVHTTYLGGGLGRKIEQDYISQAITVAMKMGRPVKLTWPREEDFGRDWYRPMALSRVQIGLNSTGNVAGWANRIVAPSCMRSHGWPLAGGVDSVAVGGAVGLDYAMAARLVEYVELPTGFKIGFWRSVGESISCFVVESAIDECARAAGVDPYQYRRRLLAGNARALAVLDAAAALGSWNTTPPTNHARGIAYSPGFGSLSAQVVEIALTSTGAIQVVHVACAVDCGMAVNPDSVIAQMQSGITHGLSSARWGRIQFDHGISQVVNFGDFRMTRMRDMPRIDVTIVSQGSPLGGIGEVGVPAVAPALANAYAALTGTRKRSLPLGI